MFKPVMTASCYDDANDQFAGSHSNGSSDHKRLTTDFVDVADGGNGSCNIYDTENSGSEK